MTKEQSIKEIDKYLTELYAINSRSPENLIKVIQYLEEKLAAKKQLVVKSIKLKKERIKNATN